MMDRVVIIAEAGVNHNGEIEKAIELIDVAADAGADFVKFQAFKAERLVNENAKKAKLLRLPHCRSHWLSFEPSGAPVGAVFIPNHVALPSLPCNLTNTRMCKA